MKLHIHPNSDQANHAAADLLAALLTQPGTRNLMLPGGNTPLELYRMIARRALPLGHLNVFALDEYVGVPLEEPRTCANLLRQTVVDAWRIPPNQFYAVSSLAPDAPASIQAHERRIAALGGIDVLILGLGKNGHLGYNEPGSAPDSVGRTVNLEPSSVASNREWFRGAYSPACGATVGLRTILSAKTILILAYGDHKAGAAAAMIEGPPRAACPASWLQRHPNVSAFLDEAAAAQLRARPGPRG